MIFADRGRGWRAAIAAVLALGLGGLYAWWALADAIGYRWCLEDAAGRDGQVLVFPLWTVTRVVDEGHYEISKVIKDVPIAGDATQLAAGDTVSVVGAFDGGDLAVHETVRELHPLRRWKEALGVLGFVFVAGAAPFAFRIEGRRLVERWRT